LKSTLYFFAFFALFAIGLTPLWPILVTHFSTRRVSQFWGPLHLGLVPSKTMVVTPSVPFPLSPCPPVTISPASV
jgi:hypothetical protein